MTMIIILTLAVVLLAALCRTGSDIDQHDQILRDSEYEKY